MISSLLGTELDQRTQALDQVPAYQVLLWSRWQDSDNDIVRGLARQTPIDLTSRVVTGSLTLDSDTDASSLSLDVSVEGLNLNIFSNCVVTVREGDARVDTSIWPTTFTGWRIGQPGSSESAAKGRPTPEEGRGPRGTERTLQVQFHSRERLFTEHEITSDGVWLPNSKPQTESAFQYRNSFDNVGSIAREIATNPVWGLGMTNDEVLVPAQPYRIEKQLQFVQVSAWEAMQELLQVLHMTPGVNGEGKVVVRDRKIDRPAARTYTRGQLVSIAQPDASFQAVNGVIVRGLSKDLGEVLKKNQKLADVSGTFGFFAPTIEYKDTWGADKDNSYRVKAGDVVDGEGNAVTSPRIRRFKQQGFINSVSDPSFNYRDEFRYEVEISNDTALVIGLISALLGGYGAAASGAVIAAASNDAVTATILQATASALLIGGIYVLQQIGHFEFEIWGVPFETVYEEIRVDSILGHFGTRVGNAPFREFERKEAEIQNYILSTEADSVVPATASEPEITNPGVRSFARRELAITLAEQATRSISTVRDILLEPGDIIEDAATSQRYYIKSISRTLQRGDNAPIQQCEGHLLPRLP